EACGGRARRCGAGGARAVGSPSEELAGARVSLPDRAGRGGGTAEHGDRVGVGLQPLDGGPVRGRFARRGLDGLHDEPRPGKPRSISDEDVERVIVKTLEQQPADATHWSTRSMAAATGMSQTAISRIWRAFGLKPHQTDAFKLSPDPQFIDKARDIV